MDMMRSFPRARSQRCCLTSMESVGRALHPPPGLFAQRRKEALPDRYEAHLTMWPVSVLRGSARLRRMTARETVAHTARWQGSYLAGRPWGAYLGDGHQQHNCTQRRGGCGVLSAWPSSPTGHTSAARSRGCMCVAAPASPELTRIPVLRGSVAPRGGFTPLHVVLGPGPCGPQCVHFARVGHASQRVRNPEQTVRSRLASAQLRRHQRTVE